MKIKPFLRRLIKQNIVYIIGNIFLFILILACISIGFSQIHSYDDKITSAKTELSQALDKVTLMKTTIPPTDELNSDLEFLNTLIPNVEDYFSIILTLDHLSQKSNFIITSYTVNIGSSSDSRLKLTVIGQGDSQSFVDFLKNYNFGGGRLITSDKIKVDPNFVGLIQIDLTFYTKAIETNNNLDSIPDAKVFQNLAKMKSSVNFNMESVSASSSPDYNYPRKANPF